MAYSVSNIRTKNYWY